MGLEVVIVDVRRLHVIVAPAVVVPVVRVLTAPAALTVVVEIGRVVVVCSRIAVVVRVRVLVVPVVAATSAAHGGCHIDSPIAVLLVILLMLRLGGGRGRV